MKIIKVFRVGRETGENIAELIEAHSQSAYMKELARNIREIVEAMEDTGGWLVITGERHKQLRRAWTPEEEALFVTKVKVLQGGEDWGQQGSTGIKRHVWRTLAQEFGRTPASLQSKYEQLMRKGRLEDGRIE